MVLDGGAVGGRRPCPGAREYSSSLQQEGYVTTKWSNPTHFFISMGGKVSVGRQTPATISKSQTLSQANDSKSIDPAHGLYVYDKSNGAHGLISDVNASAHNPPDPTARTSRHHSRNAENRKHGGGKSSRESSKRRSHKKRHGADDIADGGSAFAQNRFDHEQDEIFLAEQSEESHAWLSEAKTEVLENNEEIVRGLRKQLLDTQSERDDLRRSLDDLTERSAADKSRLDRMLLIAAKETARVEEEKMKVILEFAHYKEKAAEERAAYETELRRIRAELAMSNRHEEFLSRQLEEQRSIAEARMASELARSGEELVGLGREVEELRERCGRLAHGRTLARAAARRRPADGSSSDEEA